MVTEQGSPQWQLHLESNCRRNLTSVELKIGLNGFAGLKDTAKAQASELNKKDDTLQINILIYAMGHQAEDILTSLKLTHDELKKHDTVKAKLDSNFVIEEM